MLDIRLSAKRIRAEMDPETSLAELTAALRDPRTYPGCTSEVEVRETHISLVFITDKRVYKIKKPVNLGFVDYSTRNRRLEMCRREIDLNRRLSSGVYLGLSDITREGNCYRIGGKGKVVEHAVRMRRLSDRHTLTALLADGCDVPVAALGTLIARFHAEHGLPESGEHFGDLDHVRADWEENFHSAADWVGTLLSSNLLARIRTAVRQFLECHAAWFDHRVARPVCPGLPWRPSGRAHLLD